MKKYGTTPGLLDKVGVRKQVTEIRVYSSTGIYTFHKGISTGLSICLQGCGEKISTNEKQQKSGRVQNLEEP